eukprot:CAMPEP_0177209646 /NCGR_PEP_ID=MMETSP0367-20130122/31128_1 /TAXON_ID=447022 ORGANISM="Scrippsiella hangoei-like, Strain SHHI-4" /NCGR_SAMPLE_ID=MMETSP0367 /ASSEMBLY_ACC=CAM_ASM_000362 /LENGTH=228 /DNA_ID=CAMNT_0018658695 /DNA_START=159 /DNA_END=845 /DNA_ORIENTATION=-
MLAAPAWEAHWRASEDAMVAKPPPGMEGAIGCPGFAASEEHDTGVGRGGRPGEKPTPPPARLVELRGGGGGGAGGTLWTPRPRGVAGAEVRGTLNAGAPGDLEPVAGAEAFLCLPWSPADVAAPEAVRTSLWAGIIALPARIAAPIGPSDCFSFTRPAHASAEALATSSTSWTQSSVSSSQSPGSLPTSIPASAVGSYIKFMAPGGNSPLPLSMLYCNAASSCKNGLP